jgi:hypothetical protein
VTTSVVVGGILLSADQLLGVEEADNKGNQ